MRKEIAGILLFFLVVLTLVSLLSFSPADPSVHNATSTSRIHNLFGLIGAHLSGLLVGLFGLGAFWIPLLLLLSSIQFFGRQPVGTTHIVITVIGSIILVITTGSLFAMGQDHYVLFGNKYSSGGIIGIPAKSLLLTYANRMGALFILAVLWIIGFVMATGVSIISFFSLLFRAFKALGGKIKDLISRMNDQRIKLKERQARQAAKKSPAKEKPKKIEIKKADPPPVKPMPTPKQELFDFMRDQGEFRLPSTEFLDEPQTVGITADNENLRMQSKLLEKKLEDFKVEGKVVSISPGPVITTFEYEPAPGVKINRVVSLSDDLALALRAMSIRIVAPIPGKAVIGIEIPNAIREMVHIKDIIVSSEFEKANSKLTICLGKDIVGNPVVANLAKMPHLLIAGATGTGKSVGLNAMICSILYKASPEDVKFIMIDPKRIELSTYDDIPHLITPVVTDVKKATNALFWAVKEMERRYELLAAMRVRNISQFNKKVEKELKKARDKAALSSVQPSRAETADEKDAEAGTSEKGAAKGSEASEQNREERSGRQDGAENGQEAMPQVPTMPVARKNPNASEAQPDQIPLERLPYIVVIIDELADLMMVTSRDVELALTRLAQMARASGIHLILATQRPSVDVLTGIIKANFPTRLTFQVSSRTDSRTIIDANGAEQLLGNGDLLFLPPGTARLQRIHGAYISEEEINRITEFLKSQERPEYDTTVTQAQSEETAAPDEEEYDERYDDAVALVTQQGQASISMVQRHLRIGYNRAARIIEVMEREGIIGPADGAKPREVLVRGYDDMP